MKPFTLLLAIAIGALLASAHTGTRPALIDSFSGTPRTAVLLVLGVVLFGALWHAGTAVGRYHASGDPKQVHYIDQATAARWKGDTGSEPVDQPTARIGTTVRLHREE